MSYAASARPPFLVEGNYINGCRPDEHRRHSYDSVVYRRLINNYLD